MVNVEATTAPGTLLTAAELRAYLRLNDQGEDSKLAELLGAAVELFEDSTRRPILTRTYRQYLGRWPCVRLQDLGRNWVILGRGGVTAVNAVMAYGADGASTSAVANWYADIRTAPARVILGTAPNVPTNAVGLAVSPVGYVEFVAGWANTAAVPAAVKVAVKSLAAHWYYNPEAYTEKSLEEVAQGWARVVAQYRLGLMGEWGQEA